MLAAWPGTVAEEGTATVGFGGMADIGAGVATAGLGCGDGEVLVGEGGGEGLLGLVRAGQALCVCFDSDCCVWFSSSECGSSSSRSLSRLTGGVAAMVERGVNAATRRLATDADCVFAKLKDGW